ncbi:hypothetical protein J6590_055557 [Homalodisca vitripennis]|nr:hypothetical protein J6590_055557 [Homalodisca vitripennis]
MPKLSPDGQTISHDRLSLRCPQSSAGVRSAEFMGLSPPWRGRRPTGLYIWYRSANHRQYLPSDICDILNRWNLLQWLHAVPLEYAMASLVLDLEIHHCGPIIKMENMIFAIIHY